MSCRCEQKRRLWGERGVATVVAQANVLSQNRREATGMLKVRSAFPDASCLSRVCPLCTTHHPPNTPNAHSVLTSPLRSHTLAPSPEHTIACSLSL